MTNKILPLAAMEKVLKHAGSPRVSEKAKAALKSILEEISEEVAKKAVQYAHHAGRRTVKAEDIKLAIKERK